ncbi:MULTISPECIES: transporter substrate-binding domain-containing protein [Comamonas]|uniref:Transporter substrate-binding domain-containing protein n=1 Tax=Comamonas squillarum TaxID=2977320 RepID=A0ABY5ZVV7_9BURK|nr:transporter substrate-binding domain-containing protein [Comamonas sp. PR12]UXC17616.1 transporter substrate-binding domain-containing protein [Comamonas sp. PR12]
MTPSTDTANTLDSTKIASLIAPSGRLRAAINVGNPVLAHKRADGSAAGVSVDLAARMAAQLGLPLDLQLFEAAAHSVDAVTQGQADVGFFAVDPVRGAGIGFSAPYVLIEGAYMVRSDSALSDNTQVDVAAHEVVVGQGSAYDLYLTRALKHARILRAPTSPAVVDVFLQPSGDVAAGVKVQLEAAVASHAGLRLLPGHFMLIQQAMGLPKSRGEAAIQWLAAFVEDAKASGFVAQALAQHQVPGAVVAPGVQP